MEALGLHCTEQYDTTNIMSKKPKYELQKTEHVMQNTAANPNYPQTKLWDQASALTL
jgi:hypothetical protein